MDDHPVVLLTRPARAARPSLDGRVRGAILAKLRTLEVGPTWMVRAHMEREFVGDVEQLLTDVEERYGLPEGTLQAGIDKRVSQIVAKREADVDEFLAPFSNNFAREVRQTRGDELTLLALPDEEFLAALEHLAADLAPGLRDERDVDALLVYADQALAAHGLPFRKHARERRFEWTGDPAIHQETVAPAMQALEDSRLAGARAEFEESLGKRRAGGMKNYEDAIDEAAKSVESVLKVLIVAHDIPQPARQGARSLYGKLAENAALPGELQSLVVAAADLRNASAAHGQGAVVRDVPAAVADAAIGAAATAIALLARHLP